MNATERQQFFKQAMLVGWAMFTLVLIFCIVILVAQMISQGKSPLDVALLEDGAFPQEDPAALDTSPRSIDVSLYFAGGDGRLLVSEARRIEYSDSVVENCRKVLDSLIDGPRDNILHPVLSKSTRVRGVYLLDDSELVVDFSRELEMEHPPSASAEALMVYGVVNSLVQDVLAESSGKIVKKVRFLFEGSPPNESFPAHIDLSEPIWPDTQWIAPTGAAIATAG